jgi:hypothetical protein
MEIEMTTRRRGTPAVIGWLGLLAGAQAAEPIRSATIPFTLDHNRLLIEADFQRRDGTWRRARVWVDTGNPEFSMSDRLARDLGVDLSRSRPRAADKSLEVPPPAVRVGGILLSFQGVKSSVVFEPGWLVNVMQADANLPSTVLKRYQVVFDYPRSEFTIAGQGSLKPIGVRVPSRFHPQTGIIQIDAIIDGEAHSFALDNGSSYSFMSDESVRRLMGRHPTWPRHHGALGCANIWGWWPNEPDWPMLRLPVVEWGGIQLADVGVAGIPQRMIERYSQKAARPVDGFLGANVLKTWRVHIDYRRGAVCFEQRPDINPHDMDLVGLAVRPEADGGYTVLGVARRDGKPAVVGVEVGDKLMKIDRLTVRGATMGAVVDALRAKPGDVRTLLLERRGKPFRIEAKVERFL